MNPQNTPITILEELKRFIPPMFRHERENLETLILQEGCKTPLTVWRRQDTEGKTELILVDGHNRMAICQKHNLAYSIEEKEFRNLGEVRQYMELTQNGRRNATVLHKVMMIGAQYEAEKKNAHNNLQYRQGTSQEKEAYTEETTSKKLAKQYGTDESNVKMCCRVYKAIQKVETLNPDAIELIYQLHQKENQIRQLENLTYTDEKLVKAITNQATLNQAIKAGKLAHNVQASQKQAKNQKTTKVQNELSEKTHEATVPEPQNLKVYRRLNTTPHVQNELWYLLLGKNVFSYDSIRRVIGLNESTFLMFDGSKHKMSSETFCFWIKREEQRFDYIKYREQRFDELPEVLRLFIQQIPTPEKHLSGNEGIDIQQILEKNKSLETEKTKYQDKMIYFQSDSERLEAENKELKLEKQYHQKRANELEKAQKNNSLYQPTENDIITSLQEYNADLKRQIKQMHEPSHDQITKHLQELLDKSNESYERLLARFKALSEKYNAIVQNEPSEKEKNKYQKEITELKKQIEEVTDRYKFTLENLKDWQDDNERLEAKLAEAKTQTAKVQYGNTY